MIEQDSSQAALVLIGHGSTKNDDSGAAVFHQADELRRRRLFAQVQEGFWKQEPRVLQVVPQLAQSKVFLVPLFISEGYFSEDVIPRALGFNPQAEAESGRVRTVGEQVLFYCRPVGSHPSMTKVLLSRAEAVIRQFQSSSSSNPRSLRRRLSA